MSKARRRRSRKRPVAAIGFVAMLAVGALALGAAITVGGIWWLRSDRVGASAETLPTNVASTSSAPATTSATSAGTPTATSTPMASAAGSPGANSSSPPAPTLNLVSMTPATTATNVDATAPIALTFDAPLASDVAAAVNTVTLDTAGGTGETDVANAVMPTISPAVVGSWSQPTPASLRFVPLTPFSPGTTVTVSLPSGLTAKNGEALAHQKPLSYQVAAGSITRLQQLLAELNYLPVTFTASTPEPNDLAGQVSAAFTPPTGTYAMRFPNTPATLAHLWVPGELTAMTRGAVISFENAHQLKTDGSAGYQVWSDLIADALAHKADAAPYTWAWATTSKPETLRIWSNGSFVFSSLANTGIPAAPTPIGSWAVFLRYRSQTMQGTNPNGTKYKDAGVPYINYFNGGDAIHGFLRGSYGSQQSLGCVELPYSSAAKVWDLIGYGTVVTVS